MANFDTTKKGMKTYARILQDCQATNQVGVHLHLRQPQSPECRLGFKGRPVKVQEEKPKKLTRKQAKQQKETIKAQQKVIQPPTQEQLEAKYRALQVAKVAEKMSVPQYGRNVLTAKDLKNSVG